jgi:hypothetical protein
MRTTVTKWATKAAGAGAIALLLATPSFAQSRSDWNNKTGRGAQTSNARNGSNQANQPNGHTNNQTFNTSRDNRGATAARNDSFNRGQNAYRGQADRGQQVRRAEPVYRDRGRDVRSGVSINLGGIFRSGAISVGVGSVPAPYYGIATYNTGFVRGVVDRVDDRSGRLWLRDDASGQEIAAAVSGYDLRSLRSGDYVQLTGQWINGGVFDVTQIDNLRG